MNRTAVSERQSNGLRTGCMKNKINGRAAFASRHDPLFLALQEPFRHQTLAFHWAQPNRPQLREYQQKILQTPNGDSRI